MDLTLRELDDVDRAAVLGLRLAPGQERFVDTVQGSLDDAAAHPEGHPWYRVVCAGAEPVGFVMLSWDVVPVPPDLIGPWFLWKLLIDERHQGRGYGREVVRQVVEIVRAEGATELMTSCVEGDGGPAGFYARLDFVPTGERDSVGEVISRLAL